MLPPTPVQSIVSDLSIVTVPNPPESRQSISPPAAVLLIAPTKVLQGAVRLHGLRSLPTPDTNVRAACAFAGRAERPKPAAAMRIATLFCMAWPLVVRCDEVAPAVHPRVQAPLLIFSSQPYGAIRISRRLSGNRRKQSAQ
jgi:hypothetical protein